MVGLFRKPPAPPAIEELESPIHDLFPFPVAEIPDAQVDPGTRMSYEELATSLGFEPAELTRAQLLEFMRSEGIGCYQYEKVNEWLRRKREQAGLDLWHWRPLREKDEITEYRWGRNIRTMSNIDGYYSSTDWSCRPYERLVPIRILALVAKIEAKFGDRVRFFVSDYASPRVDPFIMVRPAKSDSGDDGDYNIIFGMWDEPGFGE